MCSWKKSWVFWEPVPMLPPFSTLPTPPKKKEEKKKKGWCPQKWAFQDCLWLHYFMKESSSTLKMMIFAKYPELNMLRFDQDFCTSGWLSSRSVFGWSTGNTIDIIICSLFSLLLSSFPSSPFFIEGMFRSISRKLTRASKNLGVDKYPDPVGHFGFLRFRLSSEVSMVSFHWN